MNAIDMMEEAAVPKSERSQPFATMPARCRWKILASMVVAPCALAAARPARALEPAQTAGRVQASGGPRFGTDNVAFGLGARGGYTIDNNVYVGGALDYFLGQSTTYSVAGVNGSVTNRLWILSAEGGYDFGLGERVVVRPYGGLGVGGVTGEVCVQGACSSTGTTGFVFTVGGLLNYFLGERMFIGPDLRLFHANSTSALVIGAHFGAAF